MMLKPKITIGAERSPNQDRYRMTLIEIESIEPRQLSHSLLQNRLCGVIGDAVGKVPKSITKRKQTAFKERLQRWNMMDFG